MGIYPFKSVKLSRADIEWLLAIHENGRGPVNWIEENQRQREGLELRGADLRHVNLGYLPLARIQGGLNWEEWSSTTEEQHDMAAVLMEGADLSEAHLEGASLRGAHLEGANLSEAHLEKARLSEAHLEGVDLSEAHLEGASLRGAHLEGASLKDAHLEGADLKGAYLEGVSLNNVILSDEKHIGPSLADVQWSKVNLAVVKWSQVGMLRDEYEARQKKKDGKVKDKDALLAEYEVAVRSNRQLAVALQAQGLHEDAARFAYRAQKLQCIVLRRHRKFGPYLFSGFLDLLAGYGYRPGRSVFWYLVMILGFTMAYYIFGHLPLLPDAFVFSLTSFHGRGFFPGNNISLRDPSIVLAAFEAVIGLLIEISFIATFTQRYFGK